MVKNISKFLFILFLLIFSLNVKANQYDGEWIGELTSCKDQYYPLGKFRLEILNGKAELIHLGDNTYNWTGDDLDKYKGKVKNNKVGMNGYQGNVRGKFLSSNELELKHYWTTGKKSCEWLMTKYDGMQNTNKQTLVSFTKYNLIKELDKSWSSYEKAAKKLTKENQNSCTISKQEITLKNNSKIDLNFSDLKKEKIVDHSGPHIFMEYTNSFSHLFTTWELLKNDFAYSPMFGEDISNIKHKNLNQYFKGFRVKIEKNNDNVYIGTGEDRGAKLEINFNKNNSKLILILSDFKNNKEYKDIKELKMYAQCNKKIIIAAKTNNNDNFLYCRINSSGQTFELDKSIYKSCHKYTKEITKAEYDEGNKSSLSNLENSNSEENLNIITTSTNNIFFEEEIYDVDDGEDKYFGQLKNGKRDGLGKYTYSNGQYAVGVWKRDELTIGIETFDGEDKYCGEYKNDMRGGYGVYQFNTDPKDTYYGSYANDKYNGFGIYYYENGEYDLGEWVNDELDGYAILYNKDHSIYQEGKYKKNKLIKKTKVQKNIVNQSKGAKSLAEEYCNKAKDLYKKYLEVAFQLDKNKNQENENNLINEEEQNLIAKKDNQGPKIIVNNIFQADENLTALIKGKVEDQSKIVSVIIDGDEVMLSQGSFSKEMFVRPNGQNVSIIALDKHGNRTETIVKLERSKIIVKENNFEFLDPRKIKSKTKENSVAIIIGVEEYENTTSAPFATNDALAFNDFARMSLGVPLGNIKLLTNDDAGRNDTIKVLKSWLPKKIIENETELFIFYSGHGLASEDGSDLYLLPSDGDPEILEDTTILRNNIFKIINDLNPKTVTMFLDTCYSGATRSEEFLVAAKPIFIEPEEQDVPINFNIFSAASGKQTAKVLKEAEHGLFSYFMMKGLEGEADTNNDRTITNGELHAFINKNVSRQANQTPQLNGDPEQVLVQW